MSSSCSESLSKKRLWIFCKKNRTLGAFDLMFDIRRGKDVVLIMVALSQPNTEFSVVLASIGRGRSAQLFFI